MKKPLPFILSTLIGQFAPARAPFGCGFKILCAPMWWMAVAMLGLCGTPGLLQAQNSTSLELEVVFEGDSTFEEGWIIASPRFSSNLTYPIVVDHFGQDLHNDLTPYRGFNFDWHPDGSLTWFSILDGQWEVLDSTLQPAGFVAFEDAISDFHDLERQTNGHVLILGQEITDVNVADSVPDPLSPNRAIIDCLIQEQDSIGNVTWFWRASDHIPPTWCTHCNWSSNLMDSYHHNAFQVLGNGDILLCLRNMDMVVRIDKATGNIVWKLGGPFSDFSFGADSEAFRHPHDAQLLGDNEDHLLLFDNGTGKLSPVTRGVEYVIDLSSEVVTQVEEWVHPDGNYASSQGSIQRLETGGTLIGWGTASSEEFGGGMITEYTADGSMSGGIYFPSNHYTYRARKVPLDQLPLIQGCRDESACNYNPQAVLDGPCSSAGSFCDDGDPCTQYDVFGLDCNCQVTSQGLEPVTSCSDPQAANFNPCAPADEDSGTCQYEVVFRADATAMDSMPEAVTLLIGSNPYDLNPAGFGTWTGSILMGNGTWNYQFMADGVSDTVQRTVSLPWPLSIELFEQRGCIGLTSSVCPGCTDPDNVAFSPFATGDELCNGGPANGCTTQEAVNYSSGAIFDDGSCQFTAESSCPSDLDGDGLVGVSDVLELLTFFGTTCSGN